MPLRRDPRIDAYIKKAKPFAKPLLVRIRAIVHRGCPKIEESIKWGMPAFLLDGNIVCGMAAFTSHGAFWFWNGKRLAKLGVLKPEWAMGGMGSFGKLRSVKDLPSAAILSRAVRRAAAFRVTGVTKART